MVVGLFFFFKQKTAYEMRISDWSSDVCSSDLKLAALEAMMERLVPGRWPTLKPPTRQELKATTVVTLALEEVVAKVRSGPPKDEPEDYALDIWAGVVPTRITLDAPESDPALKSGIAIPDNLSRIRIG